MMREDKLLIKLTNLPNEIVKAFAKSVHIIVRLARELAPVDTGRLRASIFARTTNSTVEIGSNLHYAPYVEFGHNPVILPVRAKALRFRIRGVGWVFAKRVEQGRSGKSAQWVRVNGKIAKPFLVPAAQQGLPLIVEEIRKAIKGVLEQ